jgi:hypothetical protein
MGASVSETRPSRHRELPEKAVRMATADLRKAENDTDRREEIGRAFESASAPWTLNELSGMLHRDERQLARWRSGAERVQLDVVLGSEVLWPRMVVAMARLRPGAIEVETVLKVRIA